MCVKVPVPMSVRCRPSVNVRAESRLMALRCTLFCASVCGKASVDGTLRVLSQQACGAPSGPACRLGIPGWMEHSPCPLGVNTGCGQSTHSDGVCEGGWAGSSQLPQSCLLNSSQEARLPHAAMGTLASSTLHPLILHMILLSHIYPPKTPWRQRS